MNELSKLKEAFESFEAKRKAIYLSCIPCYAQLMRTRVRHRRPPRGSASSRNNCIPVGLLPDRGQNPTAIHPRRRPPPDYRREGKSPATKL